ncbi:MAG: tRNA (adenosine(37)-N6)-threonylcarbamoyltransferase complex dimerization subunit type 1 TsaB [Deltaproteobacteria bacterium]|nr:tRNA (adenosine(37)-N6)-threonylcarbamoyltransferase complex dimerization subunit type 1 TsaB [Deltaproteobacteria bacterium]
MKHMIVLAIDTSTHNGNLGWVKFSDSNIPEPIDFASIFLPSKPGHAEKLLQRIELLLESSGLSFADISLIALGKGPGTFTGLRIGFATAIALNIASDTPICAISTLKTTALSAKKSGTVLSVMDARRKELYAAVYNVKEDGNYFNADEVISPFVAKPDALINILKENQIKLPCIITGNGAAAYPEVISELGPIPAVYETAPDICHLAIEAVKKFKISGCDDLTNLEPDYIREPDAKKPAERQPVISN